MNQLAWVGIFAPKGTPKDVLEKINKGIAVGTDTEKFQDWAASAGGGTAKPSASDAQFMFENDRVTWREAVKVLGLAANNWRWLQRAYRVATTQSPPVETDRRARLYCSRLVV